MYFPSPLEPVFRLAGSASTFRSLDEYVFPHLSNGVTGAERLEIPLQVIKFIATLYHVTDIFRIQNLRRDVLNRLLSTTPWRVCSRVVSHLYKGLAGEVLNLVDAWFELSVL